jgi:hypothetical protein
MLMEVGFTDAILVGIAFLAAFGTTTLGSTGGLLLAVMATVLPAPLAVPAHAVVEGARNGLGWTRFKRAFNPPSSASGLRLPSARSCRRMCRRSFSVPSSSGRAGGRRPIRARDFPFVCP